MCVRVRRELSERVERERESCAASSARAMGMGVGWGLGSFNRRAEPRVVARAALASAAALSRTLRSREAVVRMPSSPKPMIRRPACKQRHFRRFLLIFYFRFLHAAPQPQPVKARVGAHRKCEKLKKNLRSARFFFTCWALFRQGRRWRTQHGAAVVDATRPCGLGSGLKQRTSC